MKILEYKSVYFNSCLSILRSNIPEFIDISEETIFINYLSKKNLKYYVLMQSDEIIGCGGYGYDSKKMCIQLAWGLIDSRYHKKGYGTHLLNYRLEKIVKNYFNSKIILDTSQKTYKFYEKFDFRVDNVTEDFYAKGLDRYDMSYIIS